MGGPGFSPAPQRSHPSAGHPTTCLDVFPIQSVSRSWSRAICSQVFVLVIRSSSLPQLPFSVEYLVDWIVQPAPTGSLGHLPFAVYSLLQLSQTRPEPNRGRPLSDPLEVVISGPTCGSRSLADVKAGLPRVSPQHSSEEFQQRRCQTL